MKDSEEHNREVSSSSTPSTSSSQSFSSERNAIPRNAETNIRLKGTILEELKNVLVLNVELKGKRYAGALIHYDEDETNKWGSVRLQTYPQVPITVKKQMPQENPETLKNKAPELRRKRGLYSTKYPRSFVDNSNVVKGKLRYGRDKKVASYSSCPNSPENVFSRKDASRSFSDSGSMEKNYCDLENVSSNLTRCFDQHQSSSKSQELLRQQKTKSCTEEKTQCKEASMTDFSDISISGRSKKFKGKKVKMDNISRSSRSRQNTRLKTDKYSKKNSNLTKLSSEGKDPVLPIITLSD